MILQQTRPERAAEYNENEGRYIDKERSENIKICKTENVTEERERIIRISPDKSPLGRRSKGDNNQET